VKKVRESCNPNKRQEERDKEITAEKKALRMNPLHSLEQRVEGSNEENEGGLLSSLLFLFLSLFSSRIIFFTLRISLGKVFETLLLSLIVQLCLPLVP